MESSELTVWRIRYDRLAPLADSTGQFRLQQRLPNRCYTLEYVRWVANGGAYALSEAKRILGV